MKKPFKQKGKTIRGPHGPFMKGYQHKKDEQEFGPGKKEYIICDDCGAVYYDKAWHHELGDDVKHIRKNLDKKQVKFVLCPACKWKKDKVFEGELILENIPSAKYQEIKNAINNIDKEAQRRDPLDRILWKKEKKNEMRLYLSENQLTVFMGKKLKESFGGELDIKYSSEGPARVKLNFTQK